MAGSKSRPSARPNPDHGIDAARRFQVRPSLHGRVRGAALPPRAQADNRSDLRAGRSEEHTSELQSLMRISYAVFCLKKKKDTNKKHTTSTILQKHIVTQARSNTITTELTHK